MVKGVRRAIRYIFWAILLSPASSFAADCTLLAVNKAEGATHRVYFTKFAKEDNSGGKFKKCRIVTKAESGTQTFYVTPFRQDATVTVHKDNWP
jgi:hypothetical protein